MLSGPVNQTSYEDTLHSTQAFYYNRLSARLVSRCPHATISLVVCCAAIDEPLILMVCPSLHTRAMELPHQTVIPLQLAPNWREEGRSIASLMEPTVAVVGCGVPLGSHAAENTVSLRRCHLPRLIQTHGLTCVIVHQTFSWAFELVHIPTL